MATELSPEEEKSFSAWRKTLPKDLQNDSDYDLRGAFKDGLKADKREHFNDKYKLPNHMTFSDQSMYSSPENTGGSWREAPDGSFQFWASPANLLHHSPQELIKYFDKYEKGNTLIFPWDYSLKGSP